MKWPVHYTYNTIYVDIDTGEQITKHNFKQNYKRISTDTHEKFTNATKTRKHIERTVRARHKRQGELPFNT